MPVHYVIHEAAGMVHAVATPPYTLAEAVQYFRNMVADPRFRPGFCELIDVRALTGIDFHYDEVEQLLQEQKKLAAVRGTGPLAFLVASPAAYGIGRMCQMMAADFQVHIGVFWNEADALDFLIDPDAAPATDSPPPAVWLRQD